jgi:hypothetical protein
MGWKRVFFMLTVTFENRMGVDGECWEGKGMNGETEEREKLSR